jgi:hypothetical protein
MTPQLRQHARSLQLRLNHGRVDPVTAAAEAQWLFNEAHDLVRARWLALEFSGYGHFLEAMPLHGVLGVLPNDRLVAHVAAYRTQRGQTVDGAGQPAVFRHFFVESLPDLVATSTRVAAGESLTIDLEFVPSARFPDHPHWGSFGRDVFQRIVGGFVAALHLQLGSAVT